MTREELKRHCLKQIEGCEMWARHDGEEPHGKVYEEHKLILELLEQEPCDCISRQAAQAKIKNICNEYRLSYEDGERKAATGGSAYALGHAFDDLPPVTPKIEWIPVSERLPENQDDVLVWIEYIKDDFDCACWGFAYYSLRFKKWVVSTNERNPIVKAWMPLPEPYEPTESEKGDNR